MESNIVGASVGCKPKEQRVIRLVIDESKLICYTQIEFKEEEQYRVFEPKVEYIRLERPLKFKLSTTKTLRAVAASLLYLNPNLNKNNFTWHVNYIVEHHFNHGFKEVTVQAVIDWCWALKVKNKLRPNGRLRRIVFKPGVNLSLAEKQSIVGRINGSSFKVSSEMLCECLEELQNNDEPIVLADIAGNLNCHKDTIRRLMKREPVLNDYLKEINERISNVRDLEKYRQAVLKLSLEGKRISGYQIRKETKFSSRRLREIEEMEKLD